MLLMYSNCALQGTYEFLLLKLGGFFVWLIQSSIYISRFLYLFVCVLCCFVCKYTLDTMQHWTK